MGRWSVLADVDCLNVLNEVSYAILMTSVLVLAILILFG